MHPVTSVVIIHSPSFSPFHSHLSPSFTIFYYIIGDIFVATHVRYPDRHHVAIKVCHLSLFLFLLPSIPQVTSSSHNLLHVSPTFHILLSPFLTSLLAVTPSFRLNHSTLLLLVRPGLSSVMRLLSSNPFKRVPVLLASLNMVMILSRTMPSWLSQCWVKTFLNSERNNPEEYSLLQRSFGWVSRWFVALKQCIK